MLYPPSTDPKTTEAIPEAGAGAPDKIEVTDEMIDAGLAAYAEWDSDDRTSSVVISVYRAMASLAPPRAP